MPVLAFRRRRSARAAAVSALGFAALFSLGVRSARAQDAGSLRSAAESYHDTLPGESVNGIGLDFRQLLPIGGLAIGEIVFVDRKDRSALGRGVLRVTDLSMGSWRLTAEGGDLVQKLDASPHLFANDYLPVTYLRGGAARAETEGIAVSLFQGRNEQFQGIRLPTVVFAPESLAGATMAVALGEAFALDANVLRTTNHQPASNPLFGVSAPLSAETYGLGGTLRLSEFWSAQAKASYARYAYAPDSASPSGHFLSYVAGSILDSPRWKVQANYIHEGVNYIPLSTASVGNREGPYLLVQSLGDRLIATASYASYRNNLESNSGVPDLHSRFLSASGSYRLTQRISANFGYNQQSLDSSRDGETSRFLQKTATSELSFPTFGYTRLRYQYQTTDEPQLRQRLHEAGVEQQPPPILGITALAGVRFQHSDEGASSLLYRGAVSGSIGQARISVQGEWGRDLASSSVFALNRNQSVTASLSVPLPAAIELRVEGYWNRVSAVVNPESIFVSQYTQEQLFSINRRSLLVRFVRSFQWGRQPANMQGPSGALGQIPYGSVEGFVFQDLNGNGVRDPGEPPAVGIFVRLDGGQTAKTDASGHFVFPNVIEGSHMVGLDTEVVPVAYNLPTQTSAAVRVARLHPGQHDFGVVPAGTLSGRVEQEMSSGERAPFSRAIVTLLPSEFSTYTDSEGRYSFANLPPGRYSVRLEEASLPDGAVISSGLSEEKTLSAGEDLILDPLVFSLRVEEKPIQKILEREQTLAPGGQHHGSGSHSSSSRKRT